MNKTIKPTNLKIVIVCTLLYNFSIFSNIVAKKLLTDFPYPTSITIMQLIVTIISLKPIFYFGSIPYKNNKLVISNNTMVKFIWPLAIGKFVSTACAYVSIWKVPISYAHTVKATMPLFTIVLTRCILGEKQTTKVYQSLIPIIFGVLLATMTELNFNSIGLTFALLSTFVFALMNIFSKKLLNEKNIHHLSLLYMLSKAATFIFLPFWLYMDARELWLNWTNIIVGPEFYRVFAFLGLNAFLNFCQNLMAFKLLSMVAPLTYSIANVTKRIWVISLSFVFMRNKTSVLNILGMTIAIFGIFLYHRAKYVSRREQESLPLRSKSKGPDPPFYFLDALEASKRHHTHNNSQHASNNGYHPHSNGVEGLQMVEEPASPREKNQLTSVLSRGYLNEI